MTQSDVTVRVRGAPFSRLRRYLYNIMVGFDASVPSGGTYQFIDHVDGEPLHLRVDGNGQPYTVNVETKNPVESESAYATIPPSRRRGLLSYPTGRRTRSRRPTSTKTSASPSRTRARSGSTSRGGRLKASTTSTGCVTPRSPITRRPSRTCSPRRRRTRSGMSARLLGCSTR